MRAGVRAKLCERVREVLLNAGGLNGKKCGSGVGCPFCAPAAIYKGFKEIMSSLLVYTRVLRE